MELASGSEFAPDNVVTLHQLQRQLSGQTVLNNINASVQPGDVIGLLGKNGSGKTTLLETMLGFGFPAFGQSLLWGEKSTELSNTAKQRIGYVPQRDELPGDMTASQLFNLYSQLRPQWNTALVERLMPEWELSDSKKIKRMSEGQKQKLAIVLAVAHDPELLILDEPVASLDPIARRQFFQQLMDYACREHSAIIFSSHIVSDMERIVNRVWCLEHGVLTCDQELDALYDSVVKVDFTGEIHADQLAALDGVLYRKLGLDGGQLVLKHWRRERQEELKILGMKNIQLTNLGLEDIFLYWHGGFYAS
jgi:ABC-2 type transport system ATP-binding protein